MLKKKRKRDFCLLKMLSFSTGVKRIVFTHFFFHNLTSSNILPCRSFWLVFFKQYFVCSFFPAPNVRDSNIHSFIQVNSLGEMQQNLTNKSDSDLKEDRAKKREGERNEMNREREKKWLKERKNKRERYRLHNAKHHQVFRCDRN